MASRAHVDDYYRYSPDRPRRAVHYPGRDDSVRLPRGHRTGSNAVLMVSGLLATLIIAGGAYAVYAGVPPPPMAETPTAPLVTSYELDDQPTKANVAEVLGGPALAVPEVGSAAATAEAAEENAASASPVRTPPTEVRVEPAPVPRARPVPTPAETPPAPSAPATPEQAPYPDPTTTPPDAIAPLDVPPEAPQPLLDPDNPYR